MSKQFKATRRSITILEQLLRGTIPIWMIEEFAKDEPIKARSFSYTSQTLLLMLSQMLHLFSLNELVDVSNIYQASLSRIGKITPAKLNTFSNANRTRDPRVIERFFWHVCDQLQNEAPDFISGKHKGHLARFKTHGIYAIDASVIRLTFWCVDWAEYRQKKAAAKIHLVANVASRLPTVCVIGKGKEHDCRKEDELLLTIKENDIAILDRAYNFFPALYRFHERKGFFVVREKETMKTEVLDRVAQEDLPKNILSDETVRLTGRKAGGAYPEAIRRVTARVQVKGKWREMVFLTNNFKWSPAIVAELYKARWQVELLFKELKQTLQLQEFFGENENAVQWQIWAALLTHLLLRYQKFKSRSNCSYTRFVAIVRCAVWLKKDFMNLLRAYGIAPGPPIEDPSEKWPYLPGFKQALLGSYGIAGSGQ